jgi:predicted nucleotidyltransferase
VTVQEQIEKSGAPVPGDLLEEAVRRIVQAADPDKIVLFGSAARGAMGPHSDLDLLVIKGGQYDYHRVITDIYSALAEVEPATEVVLATPEQVDRYRDSFCLVFYPALREGKTLYERAAVRS